MKLKNNPEQNEEKKIKSDFKKSLENKLCSTAEVWGGLTTNNQNSKSKNLRHKRAQTLHCTSHQINKKKGTNEPFFYEEEKNKLFFSQRFFFVYFLLPKIGINHKKKIVCMCY